MGRKRTLLHEQERPVGPKLARLEAQVNRSEHVEPVAGELLRIQRQGGNDAVGTMLAQRDAAQAEKADAEGDRPVTATLVMEEPIGVLPLLTFSQTPSGEYSVVVPSTDKDPTLFRMCATGKSVGHVTISMRGYTIDLDNVYISSCQAGGGGDSPTVQLTLNAAKMEAGAPKKPAGSLD